MMGEESGVASNAKSLGVDAKYVTAWLTLFLHSISPTLLIVESEAAKRELKWHDSLAMTAGTDPGPRESLLRAGKMGFSN